MQKVVQCFGFQEYLKSINYNLIVYTEKSRGAGKHLYFERDNVKGSSIYLYHITMKKHYNLIISPTGALCSDFFCEQCHAPYKKTNKHRCKTRCSNCFSVPACEKVKEETYMRCGQCRKTFRGPLCYYKHFGTNCHIHKCDIYVLRRMKKIGSTIV